jgi:hypothetical protein
LGADGVQEKYALIEGNNAWEVEKLEVDNPSSLSHFPVTERVFNALKDRNRKFWFVHSCDCIISKCCTPV